MNLVSFWSDPPTHHHVIYEQPLTNRFDAVRILVTFRSVWAVNNNISQCTTLCFAVELLFFSLPET